MVLAEKQTPNHVLHLILSVVTMGFWLPVWLIVGLGTDLFGGGFKCPSCGARTLHRAPRRRRAPS